MLQSAREHYDAQQRISAAAVRQVRRDARRSLTAAAATLAGWQVVAAREAAQSVGAMLEEQGTPVEPVAPLAAGALAGVASDGRPLDSLVGLARDYGSQWLAFVAATQVQDAARNGSSIGMATRPSVVGYVRMLNPPSCSRCAVLAGRVYKWNEGFARHPLCDCRHIPRAESGDGDLTTDPDAYFESLTPEQQDKLFTKSGAQAIRDGADVGQVVNARRGMDVAQIGGRDAFVSREGVTARGRASRARTGRNMGARLMPESIYAVANDRDDALRLLKLNGFIL